MKVLKTRTFVHDGLGERSALFMEQNGQRSMETAKVRNCEKTAAHSGFLKSI